MAYTLITDNDSQFPSLRNAFNQRWVAPNLQGVYVCSNTQDVIDALTDSYITKSAYPGEVRILGGGHCYENFIYNDETKYVIDINGINNIEYDSSTQVTTIGSGQTNWGAAVVLQKLYNQQLPAGSCYSVGLGGHITGGGYGLSSRTYGLTVDYISGVEIVVPSGSSGFKAVTASENENQDLFVAIRGGGGGSFGIITQYMFKKLPPAFQNADLFAVAIDWSDIQSAKTLQSILDVYASYCGNVGTSTNISDQQLSNNIFVLGKFAHKVSKQIAFIIQSAWNAKAEQTTQTQQIQNFISDLGKLPSVSPTHLSSPIAGYPSLLPGMYGGHNNKLLGIPVSTDAQSMSWINATMTNNGSGPNQRGVYNSVYFRTKLTDAQCNSMYNYLSGSKDTSGLNYSQTLLQIDSYGGAINSYQKGDTSVKQRSSIMKGQFQTYWQSDGAKSMDLDAKYVAWQKSFFNDMFSETGGFPDPDYVAPSGQPDPVQAKDSVDGCYVNYPNSILGTNNGVPNIDHALHLYFGDAISARLKSTKTRIDPKNYFQHAQSIPVSS